MHEKDDLMARTMVENLSVGIHPLTGRALPASDCCANELVQEALKTVLEHCSLESYGSILEKTYQEKKAAKKAAREQRTALYPNMGRPWSEEEDTYLIDLYRHKGKSIRQIAAILQRSPQSVSARLKRYGSRWL